MYIKSIHVQYMYSKKKSLSMVLLTSSKSIQDVPFVHPCNFRQKVSFQFFTSKVQYCGDFFGLLPLPPSSSHCLLKLAKNPFFLILYNS